MKKCYACGMTKELTEYHKDRGRPDGVSADCKPCKALRYKKYMDKPETKEKLRLYWQDRQADPEFRKEKALVAKRQRLKPENKIKFQARRELRDAIRRGEITRLPCEVCASTEKVEGHHEDYSKPLDVQWLCSQHHVEVGNTKRLQAAQGGKGEK